MTLLYRLHQGVIENDQWIEPSSGSKNNIATGSAGVL